MKLKVVLVGIAGCGKTQLFKRFWQQPFAFEERYYPSAGFEAKPVTGLSDPEIGAIKLHLFDTSDTNQPSQIKIVKESLEDSDVILYCVDLTNFAQSEKAQEMVREYVKKNNGAKVILVGTHHDMVVDKHAAMENFDKIDIPGVKFHKKIVTSAKTDIGIDKKTVESTQHLTEIFSQIAKAKHQALKTKPKAISESTQIFPSSYSTLWNSAESEGEKALKILMDYSKVKDLSSPQCSFFNLAITGHWARSHHAAVIATLKRCNNKMSVQEILQILNKELVVQGDRVEPDGSLARRIDFIKSKIENVVFDIDSLNEQIDSQNKPINT